MHEDDGQQEQEIHLRDYIHVLQKRKWLILAAVVISFTTAAIVSFRTRPLYQSAAKIIIERETPKILSIEQITQGASGAADYYNTQYKILQSDTLAATVAERLRIWEHPEFAEESTTTPSTRSSRAPPSRRRWRSGCGSGSTRNSAVASARKAGSAQENEARLDAAAAAILAPHHHRAGEKLLPRQREGPGLRPEAHGAAGEHARGGVHRAEPAAQGRHHRAGRQLPRRAVRGRPQEARGGRARAAALQRGEQRHLDGGAPGGHDRQSRAAQHRAGQDPDAAAGPGEPQPEAPGAAAEVRGRRPRGRRVLHGAVRREHRRAAGRAGRAGDRTGRAVQDLHAEAPEDRQPRQQDPGAAQEARRGGQPRGPGAAQRVRDRGEDRAEPRGPDQERGAGAQEPQRQGARARRAQARGGEQRAHLPAARGPREGDRGPQRHPHQQHPHGRPRQGARASRSARTGRARWRWACSSASSAASGWRSSSSTSTTPSRTPTSSSGTSTCRSSARCRCWSRRRRGRSRGTSSR